MSNKPDAASAGKRQQRLTAEHVAALEAAYLAADRAREAGLVLEEAARVAVAKGVSFEAIGRLLGISRQAAHQRYAAATARRRPVVHGDTLF